MYQVDLTSMQVIQVWIVSEGKEEAFLTCYSNPSDLSGLDQARQEMRAQVGIDRSEYYGNILL